MSLMTSPIVRGIRNPYGINLSDPDLKLFLPLWHNSMQGATIYSKDLNHHSCTVTGATWGYQGRSFGTSDEIETPALGLSDANDYTICEWFEGHFRVLINTGGGSKAYYIDGVNISPATFTPTYSLSTNKILEAVA